MKFKTVLTLIIIFLILVIFAQNTQVVEVKIFFWKISMSRIILLPAILLSGFILGYIAAKLNRRSVMQDKLRKCREESSPAGQVHDDK